MASFQSPGYTAHSSPLSFPPRSPLIEEHPGDLPLNRLFPSEEKQRLHLVPCTWQEYAVLDPSFVAYNYVAGRITWCPNRADADHNSLIHDVSIVLRYFQYSQFRLSVHLVASIQIITDINALEWTREHQSNETNCNRGKSSTKRGSSEFDVRIPDFVITRAATSRSDASSSTSREPVIKETIVFPYPYTDKLLAVGEITSPLTRPVDLHTKWNTYARSEVPLYIILDRGTETKPGRVIVGSLRPLEGAELSISGDKHVSPANRRQRSAQPPCYYRKEYLATDIVDCPYFSELHLTVEQMVSARFMWKLATSMENDYWRAEQEIQKIRQKTKENEEHIKQNEEYIKQTEEYIKQSKQEREEMEEYIKQTEEYIKQNEEYIKQSKQEREETEEYINQSKQKREELEEQKKQLKQLKQKIQEKRRKRKFGTNLDQEKQEVRNGNLEGGDEDSQPVKKCSTAASSSKPRSPEHKKSRKQKNAENVSKSNSCCSSETRTE